MPQNLLFNLVFIWQVPTLPTQLEVYSFSLILWRVPADRLKESIRAKTQPFLTGNLVIFIFFLPLIVPADSSSVPVAPHLLLRRRQVREEVFQFHRQRGRLGEAYVLRLRQRQTRNVSSFYTTDSTHQSRVIQIEIQIVIKEKKKPHQMTNNIFYSMKRILRVDLSFTHWMEDTSSSFSTSFVRHWERNVNWAGKLKWLM